MKNYKDCVPQISKMKLENVLIPICSMKERELKQILTVVCLEKNHFRIISSAAC